MLSFVDIIYSIILLGGIPYGSLLNSFTNKKLKQYMCVCAGVAITLTLNGITGSIHSFVTICGSYAISLLLPRSRYLPLVSFVFVLVSFGVLFLVLLWFGDILELSRKFPKQILSISKTFPGSFQAMSKTCPRDVQDMSKLCSTHVQVMSKTSKTWQIHIEHMSNTCPKHVQRMFKQCLSHVQHMSKTCPKYIQSMSSTTYPKHVLVNRFSR